jgi:signal transduction histidine kinase
MVVMIGSAVSCQWDADLQQVGADRFGLPVVFRVGMPVLALCGLVATAVVALVAPRAGDQAGPFGLALLGLAAVPWLLWLLAGDDDSGPTAAFAALALVPFGVLAIGGQLTESVALGSDLAAPLLTFPVLLVVLLYVAFSTVRLAVVVAVAGYAVLSAAGYGIARDVVTWHVGFGLCVAAGYAVRLSYLANQEVVQAREARAQQEAADERRRVARDVHDVVAHSLAVTMLHVTAARMAVVRSAPADAEEALVEAERHGRASLNDIRRVVGLLRNGDRDGGSGSALDAAQPGLADVDELVRGFQAAGLTVEATIDLAEPVGAAAAAAELAGYRVLQEALANAARHGEGSAVVELTTTAGELRLTVANPVAAGRQPGRGSGLLGMRERVVAAGGSVEAGMRDGRWVVRATVPVDTAAPVETRAPVDTAAPVEARAPVEAPVRA